MSDDKPLTIYTIGHSTRDIDTFRKYLTHFDVRLLVDVRTVPRSRRYPHFGRELLPKLLGEVGIHYLHLPELGGLRKPQADSKNVGWRNENFRGYADYMQTPPFEKGITTLIEKARQETTAMMCAEAVPWRCHRSLVGDALIARGIDVKDIMSESEARPHKLTPFAQVNGTQVTYPTEDNGQSTMALGGTTERSSDEGNV